MSCFPAFCMLGNFFNLLRSSWHMALCKFKVYQELIWHTYIYCKMIPTEALPNTFTTLHNHQCLVILDWMKDFPIYCFGCGTVLCSYSLEFLFFSGTQLNYLETVWSFWPCFFLFIVGPQPCLFIYCGTTAMFSLRLVFPHYEGKTSVRPSILWITEFPAGLVD